MFTRLRLIAALVAAVIFQTSAQCLVIQNCPAQPLSICDNGLNNAQFWNETYYWDNALELHDLFEAETNLEISVRDTCSFDSLRISYVLLLDLDGDGATETAVWSDSLPPADAVYFGNALNPNYSGGALRHFDERGVPADQKFGFALEQVTQGDTLTAKLRWNTAAASTQYQLPQLPGGTHKIRWFIESGAVHDTCEQTFTIKDCKAPSVNCLVGPFSVNIMPTQMIQLWASDFLKNAEDNITPASQIRYAVRKSGTGTGFPVDSLGNPLQSFVFTCAEIGTHAVELWAQDKAGNADFCETYVIIQDNFGNCGSPEPAKITVCVETEQSNGVEDMIVKITGTTNSIPSFTFSFTAQPDNSGCVHFDAIPLNSTGTITPIKDDNPLNGVSTYDLILITRHLLSQEPLNSPYKMIAADANKSNSISTFDIVELRRLILGIYSELPNNTSWRCILKDFTFPNPNNPFQTAFPESAPIVLYQPANFVAVKVGDVNGTAIANSLTDAHSDDRAPSALLLPDQALQAGQTIEIPVTVPNAGAWLGFQMGLQYDPRLLALESIEPSDLPGMSAESFATAADEIRCSWSDGITHTILPGDRLFTLHARALAPVNLRDAISLTDKRLRAEAYAEGNQPVIPLQLEFGKIQGSNNGASVFAPHPNPTSAGATIPLQLTENTPVQIELRDVSGRLLYNVEQTLEAGRHLLDVPAAAMPDAGLYFWTVKAGALRESGKLVRE